MHSIQKHILPSGNLILIANNEARHDLAETWREHADWDRQWYDVVGPFQENGILFPVEPEDIAALTSAPILTDDLSIEDDGSRVVRGAVWWFPNYMIADPLELLRRFGRVEFVKTEG